MNISLLRKVQMGLFLASALPMMVGFGALYYFYTNTTDYVAGGSVTAQIMNDASALQKDFGVLIQDWKNIMLRGRDPKAREKYTKDFFERVMTLQSGAKTLQSRLPEEKYHFVTTFTERLDVLVGQYKKAIQENLSLEKFEPEIADAALRGKDRNVLDSISELVEGLAAEDKKAEDQMLQQSYRLLWSASLVSLFLGLLVFAGVSLFINRVVKTLMKVALSVDDVSTQLTTASNEVSTSSQELSESTTEQSAALEQTAASIEEMSSMVSRNAESSKQVSEVSNQSKKSAEKGKHVVGDMINSMGEINGSNQRIMEQVNQSNNSMTEIANVITNIADRTRVINDIVFQTKLLSFNASVEAARAGEAGKGFAVVAEEVGKLAQMSGDAAKQISDMLHESIQKVERITKETQTQVETLILEGKEKVETGTQIASKCGEVLDEIVVNVSQVSERAHEISAASTEQATGVQEISKAMGNLDQATQKNSSVTQQVAASAEELSAQAESLKSIVVLMMSTLNGKAQL